MTDQLTTTSTTPTADTHAAAATVVASAELVAAQALLMARRAAAGVTPIDPAARPSLQLTTSTDGAVTSTAVANALLMEKRAAAGIQYRAPGTSSSPWVEWATERVAAARGDQLVEVRPTADRPVEVVVAPADQLVRVHPDIWLTALYHKLGALVRVYYLLRSLDTDGRGWVTVAAAREGLTPDVFGWRRLRQILAKGDGVFWRRDDRGRVWVSSTGAVTAALRIDRLTGAPVEVPRADLAKGMHLANATAFTTYHVGRPAQRPVSRGALVEVTGVKSSTQRRYDATTSTSRCRNLLILGRVGDVDPHLAAWDHGRAVYVFTDHVGRVSRDRGVRYVARELPSTYSPNLNRYHRVAARGRVRKVNRQLKHLVTKGARGKDDATRLIPTYHDNAAAADQAQRRSGRDTYYRVNGALTATSTTPSRLAGVNLWRASRAEPSRPVTKHRGVLTC